MTSDNITVMFLSLGILLGVARIFGELAQRWRQPAVLGELLAGVLLGPTILGNLSPEFSAFLFPAEGPNKIALETITTLSIAMFLLVAGMEVDLSTVWRQGKVGLKVGTTGMVIPFVVGFTGAWFASSAFGRHPDVDPFVFSLFFATALSISALPVIAKMLRDMGLYRSDFGMVVISAAILDDLTGWIAFAIILGLMEGVAGHDQNIALTITLTLVFAATVLTVGRWLIHRALPYLQAYTRGPGGVLGFALMLALFGAAFTEWIGIHAVFGAFLVGVAIGDSSHLRERTRVTIDHFVSFIFAPVFFASIGLKVNFITEFDVRLVSLVLVIACVCKLAGGALGARWGGMPPREAWAVGFAVNARGAMEIILGLLALQAGIVDKPLFVALIVMAMVTSLMGGPAMRMVLGHAKKQRLTDLLSAKHFVPDLQAVSRRDAIRELATVASSAAGLDGAAIETAVWAREEALSTGIGNGVALPHARIEGLRSPVVAAGISRRGIDFDAPDDKPAHVIFLVLASENDPGLQMEIVAEIARVFREPQNHESIVGAGSFTNFLAVVTSASAESRLV